MVIFHSYVKLPEGNYEEFWGGFHGLLVGGLEQFLFSIIYGIILPID